MQDLFYITKPDGFQEGPYTYSQLDERYRYGKYPDGALVWYARAGKWQPINKVFGDAGSYTPAPEEAPASLPQRAASYCSRIPKRMLKIGVGICVLLLALYVIIPAEDNQEKLLQSLPLTVSVEKLQLDSPIAYSPSGDMIAMVVDKKVILWDVYRQCQIGEALNTKADCLCFSPDGRYLATGLEAVRLWDTKTQRQIGKTMPIEEKRAVNCISFSPNGKLLAAGATNGVLRLWDTETQRQVGKPMKHLGGVMSICFSPDGRKLAASGFNEDGIRLWDVETQKAIGKPMQHHGGTVRYITFNPDGSKIATAGGSMGRNICLWQTETQQQLGETLETPEGRAIRFTPDGRNLIACTYSAFFAWETETQQQLETIKSNELECIHAAFSPDARILAIIRTNKIIFIKVQP